MDDERFCVGHVGKQGEQLKAVDEVARFLCAASDLKGEDGAA